MTTKKKEADSKWATAYDILLGVMYAYLVSQLMKIFLKYVDADKPISDQIPNIIDTNITDLDLSSIMLPRNLSLEE